MDIFHAFIIVCWIFPQTGSTDCAVFHDKGTPQYSIDECGRRIEEMYPTVLRSVSLLVHGTITDIRPFCVQKHLEEI